MATELKFIITFQNEILIKIGEKMKKTNGLAITSMILGIVSVFLFWIPIFGLLLSLTGLTLGIISVRKISSDKNLTGKGLAITGIVLSAIMIIPSLIFTIIGISYFGVFSFNKPPMMR
jgi:uncharacterized membrane protein